MVDIIHVIFGWSKPFFHNYYEQLLSNYKKLELYSSNSLHVV